MAELNPVGAFEFATATPDGTPAKGTITIIGQPGAYAGSIDAGEHGTFPIRSVTVTGQALAIAATHPQGSLEIRVTFVGDAFNGSWQLGTDTGEIVGKRKP